MGTTVEGGTDEVWTLLRAVHEATLHAGADVSATLAALVMALAG